MFLNTIKLILITVTSIYSQIQHIENEKKKYTVIVINSRESQYTFFETEVLPLLTNGSYLPTSKGYHVMIDSAGIQIASGMWYDNANMICFGYKNCHELPIEWLSINELFKKKVKNVVSVQQIPNNLTKPKSIIAVDKFGGIIILYSITNEGDIYLRQLKENAKGYCEKNCLNSDLRK